MDRIGTFGGGPGSAPGERRWRDRDGPPRLCIIGLNAVVGAPSLLLLSEKYYREMWWTGGNTASFGGRQKDKNSNTQNESDGSHKFEVAVMGNADKMQCLGSGLATGRGCFCMSKGCPASETPLLHVHRHTRTLLFGSNCHVRRPSQRAPGGAWNGECN